MTLASCRQKCLISNFNLKQVLPSGIDKPRINLLKNVTVWTVEECYGSSLKCVSLFILNLKTQRWIWVLGMYSTIHSKFVVKESSNPILKGKID